MFFWSWFQALDTFLHDHMQFAPSVGSIIGALLTVLLNAIVLVTIAKIFTKRAQMVTATFEFNKKYHEIIEEGQKISSDFAQAADDLARDSIRKQALTWWVKYFDFNLFELQFYREGFFVPERFTEYMQWRRLEFSNDPFHTIVVADVNYAAGWQHFASSSSLTNGPFIKFLDEIHQARTPRQVRWIVKNASSKLRWRLHLTINALAEML
jgi:hypothetical protein